MYFYKLIKDDFYYVDIVSEEELNLKNSFAFALKTINYLNLLEENWFQVAIDLLCAQTGAKIIKYKNDCDLESLYFEEMENRRKY